MSRIRRQSKSNGMALLRSRWLQADVILLLTALMILGVSMLETAVRKVLGVSVFDSAGKLDLSAASWITAGAFSVLTLLVTTPVFAGQTQWYWSLSEKTKLGVGDVFAWLGSVKLYFKSVGVAADIFVRTLLWGALTCGGPAAMIAAAYIFFPKGADAGTLTSDSICFVMLVGFGGVLLAGGIFLLLYISMRYFLAYFLLAEDSSRRVRAIVGDSVRYTKGQRWELMKFCLSFILWFVQIYFILPALFVLPYFFSSSAMYSKHLIYAQRAKERAQTAAKTAEKARIIQQPAQPAQTRVPAEDPAPAAAGAGSDKIGPTDGPADSADDAASVNAGISGGPIPGSGASGAAADGKGEPEDDTEPRIHSDGDTESK
jgi:uncharacterized membrane protein